MAVNIAPDESKFRAYPWTAATWTAASSKKQVSEITQDTRGRRPRLRTELTDQAGLTKPKQRHEYFPNLHETKGFSHGFPTSRRQKFSRRRETQRHECIDEYGFQSRVVSRGSWRVEA